ncbi:MAG TPA: hypothetical protein VKV30_03080 [Candidatus Angelobacter sp.]|nr:hypothetical protein [Candidatus Angelobacter sp.]
MATQLQPPQPELVSQEKEVLRAHPSTIPSNQHYPNQSIRREP